MKLDAEHLIARLAVVRLKARAVVREINQLEQDIHDILVTSRPPRSAAALLVPEATAPCACPLTQRVVTGDPAHPQRTKCRLCDKEHD